MDNASYSGLVLSSDLRENIDTLSGIFKNDDILRIRHLTAGVNKKCAVLFMDGMINNELLTESVIRPLILLKEDLPEPCDTIAEYISQKVLFAGEVTKTHEFQKILDGVLYGDTALIIDGTADALIINTKGWRTRGINEPANEQVLQGPREGFDESVMLNAAMLRRKLPTADLKVEYLTVGRKTETKMFLCYLSSVADKNTVKEIKDRIKKIDIDGVLDSNYITELIRSNKASMFKTVGSTERPDIVAARLLEGRIALLVDGTPVAITMPYLFSENFQADDDYYLNYWYAAIGRVLRYISFFLTISVPAIYISLCIFHPYLLPTSLITTICASRSGVPFPTFVECLLLVFVFEILRETGIRMPQSVGHALSIVGGLVVGQAAVEAKIVSAPMLIIIALSGICGLMVPRVKAVCFYLKIFLILLSSMFGLFGYFLGMILLLINIFNLNSFGTDYTAALSYPKSQSLKDSIIRMPWTKMIKRPPSLSNNTIRQRKRK